MAKHIADLYKTVLLLPLPPQYAWHENGSQIGAKYRSYETWCMWTDRLTEGDTTLPLYYCRITDTGSVAFINTVATYAPDQIEDVLHVISTSLLLGIEQTYNKEE